MSHKCRVIQLLRINQQNRYLSTKSSDKFTNPEFAGSSKTRIIKRSPREKKQYDNNLLKVVTKPIVKMGTDKPSQIVKNSIIKSSELRLNEINVQMLSKSICDQIFKISDNAGTKSDVVSRCQRMLFHHGIRTEDCPQLPDVNFKLPKLQGKDILEHFYNIGDKQSGVYRALIEQLIKDEIPTVPKEWVFIPGWHRYEKDGTAVPVPFPPEDALVFDVEVCMSAGTNPTLACAVSPTHWYGWVSQTLIDGSAQPKDTVHYGLDDLVPLESLPTSKGYKLKEDLLRPKLVVGHNVSYDRARIKEQYWLERTGTRFLDTMSMHVCVSGVTSYQRAILKSKDKLIEPEDENWIQISSLNSLAEVHKLYCGTALSKEARNTFVVGNLQDVKDDFQNLMNYCAGDVIATSSVLRNIYPMFRERFPHPVTLAGMLELGTAYLPVNSSWNEYINTSDLTYEDIELECKFFLARKAEKACSLMHNQEYTKDLWMWDQDWSTQELKLKKPTRVVIKKQKKPKKGETEPVIEDQNLDLMKDERVTMVNRDDVTLSMDDNVFGAFDFKGEFNHYRINPKVNTIDVESVKVKPKKESKAKKIKTVKSIDVVESTTSIEVVDDTNEFVDPLDSRFKYLFDLAKMLPVRRPLLPGYPAWYRKLCTKASKDDENWVPGPHNIGTGMQITPKLLSLSWEGYPLHYIRGHGWGFIVPYRADRPSIEEGGIGEDTEGLDVPFESLLQRCPVVDPQHLAANAVQSEGVLKKLWQDVESHIGKRDYYSKPKKEPSEDAYKGTGVFSGVTLGGTCFFMRLPHKDGAKSKVGNPLAKDFINKFSENVLNGEGVEAEKVLTAARMLSYWRNNRDRIKNQKVIWLDDKDLPNKLRSRDKRYGAILPQVVVCGTLTRRAMEPTWMTASNAHKERIGSELRSMIQCPPGYNFVGADVDSQELWIAAILGDSQFGLHGATPFGWMTLAGSKAAGTDMHSHTAKAASITRDHAKVINYARIYGAGQMFAERLLKQFNPSMSDGDAKTKAQTMFSTTKGRRYYRLKKEYIGRVFGDEDYRPEESEMTLLGYHATKIAKANGLHVDEMFDKPKWRGGTESDMFNRLEEIAGSEEPRTPFLSCQLTRALMADEELRKRHLPTAINWVVQSGAVDFLHLMLVNMSWLTGSKARFCLSFHDEVRYMVQQQYRYETALALHITNLFTRAFCSKRLGLNDLPQSVAFFSSVDVDTSLRKEAHMDCVTPSNPHGLAVGYNVPAGETLDIKATLEKCGPGLDKLFKDKNNDVPIREIMEEAIDV